MHETRSSLISFGKQQICCSWIYNIVAVLGINESVIVNTDLPGKVLYTVSQKERPTYGLLGPYNFETHEQILIFLAEMLPIK